MISFDLDQQAVPAAHRLSRALLGRIAQALAKHLPGQVVGRVDVNFINDTNMRRLNRMYRHIDKVTDVLSFAAPAQDMSGQLGDVLISFAQAKRQAPDGDIELELVDLIIHGTLHLLGYDHELAEDADRMFPLQDLIVAECL